MLEPPEPIEVECTECGEVEEIFHIIDAEWFCHICNDSFSDGTDIDYFYEDNLI